MPWESDLTNVLVNTSVRGREALGQWRLPLSFPAAMKLNSELERQMFRTGAETHYGSRHRGVRLNVQDSVFMCF